MEKCHTQLFHPSAGLSPRPLSRRFTCGFSVAAALADVAHAAINVAAPSLIVK